MDDAATIPALQLLLGDLNNEQRCALINRAFPDDHIWHVVDRAKAKHRAGAAIANLDEIARINAGDSPIGRLGQERVRREALACERDLQELFKILQL